MKYYKLIKDAIHYPSFTPNKIYPESFAPRWCSVLDHYKSNLNNGSWIEVPAGEYFVQEGKMPEYFAIKKVEGDPLWQKYIDYLNNTYNTNWGGHYFNFYGYDNFQCFGGTDGKFSLEDFKNNPVELTLEQWDKIINKTMEEEFELPEFWQIRRNGDNYKMINKWMNKHHNIKKGESPEYTSEDGHVNSKNKVKSKDPSLPDITTEQFVKYVLNQEVMEKSKEIIGWKLKEDCKQYEEACISISKLSVYPALRGYYCIGGNTASIDNFKKAGVLELWFEPVYEEEFKVGDWYYDIENEYDCIRNRCLPILEINGNEIWCKDFHGKSQLSIENFKKYYRKATPEEIEAAQTLRFGGYDVTFEKVTSGVRISCNGETGTCGQIEAIYNYFKPNSINFRFGSQEVRKVIYNKKEWNIAPDDDEPTSIKIGCTTGTWSEFVAIYEKAKSML